MCLPVRVQIQHGQAAAKAGAKLASSQQKMVFRDAQLALVFGLEIAAKRQEKNCTRLVEPRCAADHLVDGDGKD